MVPLETFAGKDLLNVYTEMQEKGVQTRKTLQAKLSLMSEVRSVIQPFADRTSSSKVAKGAPGDDSEGESEEEGGEGEEEEESEKEEDANDTPAEITEEPASDGKKGSEDNATEEENVPVHDAWCDGCRVRLLLKMCCHTLADVGSILPEWTEYQRKQVEVHGLYRL